MNKELINFITYAKKQGYASTISNYKKTKDGGKSCLIKKGDYLYTDTYFGNLIDCGQERIYHHEKVIWVMAYRGGMCAGFDEMEKEAFNFLKKCISRIPKGFPARGPRKFKQGKFIYENKWNGNIGGFSGEENLYYGKEKICFRNYLGGLVKNRQ